MRRNLELTDGLILSEQVALAVGGDGAHDVVREAALGAVASGRSFEEELRGSDRVSLSDEQLTGALDPATYIGSAEAFVDRALARVPEPTGGGRMRLAHSVGGGNQTGARALEPLGTTRACQAGCRSSPRPWCDHHPGHEVLADKPITVEDLAPVAELLDFLEIEQASFCGISLGGAVGMALALHAPDRVDRLVLACTSARFGEPAMWHDRAGAVRAGGTTAIADAVLRRWFTAPFASDHADVAARFRAMLESVPSEGYAACCEALADWDARESVRRIEAPTLVIAGVHDVATPPSDAEYLAESIPGARLAILDHAAHLANVEQPEAFDRVLLEHLAVPVGAEGPA